MPVEIINHIRFEKNPLQIMEQALVTGNIHTISTPNGNVVIMSEEQFNQRLADIEIEPDANEVRITHLDLM